MARTFFRLCPVIVAISASVHPANTCRKQQHQSRGIKQTRDHDDEPSPMPNGRCRMHGGMSPGAPKGNKNAFKHGHYAAEAIASRREIAKLLRDARALVKQVS